MTFPNDFVWGCATASYQIEGAAFEDGKGWSVWDMMCRREGAIWHGQNGDVSCDHYRRYKEDVGLMAEIGLGAYRFSVSWPRVIPDGIGAANAAGLDFYSRLVDELLAHGIQPWVTLFHWDYPLALYRRGGWLNRDTADWFGEYVALVVKTLGDRVKHWITHNEPQCTIGKGHLEGGHAPGDKLATREWLLAAHNLLLSHGKAVQTIRSHSPSPCQVGWAPVGCAGIPATDAPQDVAAAQGGTYAVNWKNTWNMTWWNDPVFFGAYPEDGLKLFGSDAPHVASGDMDTIRQPLDFLGYNLYYGPHVRLGAEGKPEIAPESTGHALTAFDWPITPRCMYWAPKFFYERYKIPLVVTENGIACCDWVALDGQVHDEARIDYLHRYLRELKRALGEGVPVKGYFLWSLMDNFEWEQGYKQRFGIIHVDYPSGRRTLKNSAYWYRDVISTQGADI